MFENTKKILDEYGVSKWAFSNDILCKGILHPVNISNILSGIKDPKISQVEHIENVSKEILNKRMLPNGGIFIIEEIVNKKGKPAFIARIYKQGEQVVALKAVATAKKAFIQAFKSVEV